LPPTKVLPPRLDIFTSSISVHFQAQNNMMPSEKLWWLDDDHIFLSHLSLWGTKTSRNELIIFFFFWSPSNGNNRIWWWRPNPFCLPSNGGNWIWWQLMDHHLMGPNKLNWCKQI
jgi:hypothetical protein